MERVSFLLLLLLLLLLGLECLKAGKALLLEKPTALNVQEAVTLWRMAQSQGLATALDFEYRFVPAWQYLADLLHSGYVGQPYLVRLDWLMSSRVDPSRPWNWYAQREQGGGVLGALGSHSFDYLYWLLGPARRISSNLRTAIQKRPDPLRGELRPVDAEDIALINLELADGTPCQIALSSVCRQGRGHWLEVYGDRGTLIIGSGNQQDYVHGFRLWGSQHNQSLQELPVPQTYAFREDYPDGRLAPFLGVVDYWVNDIQQGTTTVPSLREGVYSQLLMDLCLSSHAEGGVARDIPPLERVLS
jgi:predicted dehydrogenase